MRQRTEVRAEIIRPDHQRQNPSPKCQVEKADGEEPSGAPRHAHAGVRLDSHFSRILSARICSQDSLRLAPQYCTGSASRESINRTLHCTNLGLLTNPGFRRTFASKEFPP